MSAKRPANIILIHADQHRFDCVGVNGPTQVRTPNLDRLATEGINFSNAFTPCPLCFPARNSLLCGQWPAEHLCIANFDTEAPRGMKEGLPTFSRVLNDADYSLGCVGKWHVHTEKEPEDFGFNEYVPEWRYAKWREKQGLPARPRDAGWQGQTDPYVTPEQSRLAWGAGQIIRMLEERADSGRPFFLRWDPVEPHLANVVPEPFASMYPPESIPPWGSFGDSFEGKPYIQSQQLRTWNLEGWTWEQWAPIVGRYLGEISLLDAQIGRIMDAVDSMGLAENTAIIYTADHGDMAGSHGMLDKHYIMYDDVVRVPLIARWPGTIDPGQTCTAFVSSAVDLATTFCELAGAPVPDTFRGQSLTPLFDGAPTNKRRNIFCTYHGNQFGLYSQRMVRDNRWKYVWNATAEDELYDLHSDPWELTNRATDPAVAAELGRLRERLVTWMQETNDTLFSGLIQSQILEGRTV